MSPTSYQAAPPRTTTIADAQAPVKPARQTQELFLTFSSRKQGSITTRCKEYFRRAKRGENSNEHQPCRCWTVPDSAPRCRTAPPSLPLQSSGRQEPCANSLLAQDHPVIAAR